MRKRIIKCVKVWFRDGREFERFFAEEEKKGRISPEVRFSSNRSFLHLSVLHVLPQIVEQLIYRYNFPLEDRDIFSKTPLFLAAEEGYGERYRMGYRNKAENRIFDTLVEASADVNAVDMEGRPVLLATAQGDYFETFLKLLEAGADPNAHTPLGMPLLHYFIEKGMDRYAEVVARHPSTDLAARDLLGRVALHIAYRKRNFRLCALLKSLGAPADVRDIYGRLPSDYTNSSNQ